MQAQSAIATAPGITGAQVVEFLKRKELFVAGVQPGTPAAGVLKRMDVIIGANGRLFADPEDPRPEMGYALAAAALAGSIGIAPTANLNPERQFPSMFEPIHGSAFDITGQGVANPIGTFWTACMMLDHLGETDASARLMRAIEQVTAEPRFHTPDLGGTARTADVTAAVIDALRG